MKPLHILYFLVFATSLSAWSFFAPTATAASKSKILIMPKLVGIPYYNAVKQGVDQAASELKDDTTVIWQGPTTDQVDKQIEMLDNAISAKPSVIAVAADDPAAIVPVLIPY
jgi:rhamnose transport system substrate-binding protein